MTFFRCCQRPIYPTSEPVPPDGLVACHSGWPFLTFAGLMPFFPSFFFLNTLFSRHYQRNSCSAFNLSVITGLHCNLSCYETLKVLLLYSSNPTKEMGSVSRTDHSRDRTQLESEPNSRRDMPLELSILFYGEDCFCNRNLFFRTWKQKA